MKDKSKEIENNIAEPTTEDKKKPGERETARFTFQFYAGACSIEDVQVRRKDNDNNPPGPIC